MATSTPKDAWYVSAYWAIYRFFRWGRFSTPRRIYKEIKWFIQRGSRGWADRDVWSLDWYLNTWMPDALRRLRDTKIGTPFACFPEGPEYIKPCGNPTKEAHEIAEKNWDTIINKMIAGFEAAHRLNEMSNWDNRDEDQKIFDEGMKLFHEYYFNLWD